MPKWKSEAKIISYTANKKSAHTIRPFVVEIMEAGDQVGNSVLTEYSTQGNGHGGQLYAAVLVV